MGCVLLDNAPRPTPLPNVLIPSATPSPLVEPPPTPDGLSFGQDARAVMRGVCFEAALLLRNQVFILRSMSELEAFWARVDGLEACRRPIVRPAFDFVEGGVLIGLWSYGFGCVARHDIESVSDTPDSLSIVLIFLTEGTCHYELLRPFWVFVPDMGAKPATIHVRLPD